MTPYRVLFAATAMLGIVGTLRAADSMSGQGRQGQSQMEKQQSQGLQKESELGLKGKSSEGQSERRELGAGPMGEESKGGAGQSGTKGLPPGPAPGFEGAGKEPGRGPDRRWTLGFGGGISHFQSNQAIYLNRTTANDSTAH